MRLSPSRTASVRLPETVSPGMSRRLFTTSRATANMPTGTDTARVSGVTRTICTKAEPVVATTPKNTKTNSSPNPA